MNTSSTPRLDLIPYPQRIEVAAGRCQLAPGAVIRLLAGSGDEELFTAEAIRQALKAATGVDAEFRASAAPPEHAAPDILLLDAPLDFSKSPEAYRLRITAKGIEIVASAPQGRFYAAQTLRQLLLQFGSDLPLLTIEDHPDLPHRGVMLDVSRGKVPTLDTLKALVERFSGLKINQLQLYIEHTFTFERHPLPGQGHSPLTAEDILALDAHCRRHHVALVPNLQSFGHVHETLIHDRYKPLAESGFRGGWTLSPAVPEVYDLLGELYAEFLPLFSNRAFFNVDCDETWDLGKGKSKPLAEAHGLGRVYFGHLQKVRKLIEPYGRRMAFWGDILEQHPELIPEIPRDAVLLNWFYDAHGQEAKYINRSRPAQEAGLEHWVCPGTSGWLSFFFRKQNAHDNIAAWADVARQTGATGLLNTDWGDAGHLNCISYSYWSFAWGADRAWRTAPDSMGAKEFDERFMAVCLPGAPPAWREALDLLGNQYQCFTPSNGAPAMVHRALLNGLFEVREGKPVIEFFYSRVWPMPSVEELLAALETSEKALALLSGGTNPQSAIPNPHPAELALVQREWRAGAALGACACRRALAFHKHPAAGAAAERQARLKEALDALDAVWTARNRPSDWSATRRGIESAA